MSDLIEQLREHLQGTGLIPDGARVMLGYSGGADSTCLLHLLSRLQIDVVAGHLHHGQRPEADAELEMCRRTAERLEVPFISGQADVPRLAREMKIGLEEAGRKARYAFLEQAARHYDASLVATAHTRTDHIETVLHHIVRGCGLPGLTGIAAQRGTLIRPILIFERGETRAYCGTHALPFHDDPANSDFSFSRARIRHRILPELEAINPAANEAIARMADLVAQENRFLNGIAASALERLELPLNGDLAFLTKDVEVAFRRREMSALPDVVLNRGIRLAAEALGAGMDRHETFTFSALLRSQESGAVTVAGGEVVVEWSSDMIHVRELSPPPPFRSGLDLPGEVTRSDLGWKLAGSLAAPSGKPAVRAALEIEAEVGSIVGSIYYRPAQPADRMQPLGFSGHRKLSDLIGEAKLTSAARARLPIVCDMLGPLWAPGVCVDERTRVSGSGTVAVLRLEPT